MILVIDNYDSFTYNLVQLLGELGAEIEVRRNDDISLASAKALGPAGIVISPGPGEPRQAGVSLELIRSLGASVPMLGVCLGHQAIGEAYGGRVVRSGKLMHGKTSSVMHDGRDLFHGIQSPLDVMRYHSLTIETASLPDVLEVTAWAEGDKGEIHGVRHREYPVWGVQFHPESVMTESGKQILANFLRLTEAGARRDA